jgi:hypothetical protein
MRLVNLRFPVYTLVFSGTEGALAAAPQQKIPMIPAFPIMRLLAALSSVVVVLAGCAGSPANPYSVNSSVRVPHVTASPSVSITGLSDYPELCAKLSHTLTNGGLKIADSSTTGASLNIEIGKYLMYAYDDRDVFPFRLGLAGQRVTTGREMMVELVNGDWKNCTWTYGQLPGDVQPFFTSRPIEITLTANGKVVYRHGGEFIVSSDGKVEANSLYFLYPYLITDTAMPCACLTGLGHYSLLKTGTDKQKHWMLFWIGMYRCDDAKTSVEELMATNPSDSLRAACVRALEKIDR